MGRIGFLAAVLQGPSRSKQRLSPVRYWVLVMHPWSLPFRVEIVPLNTGLGHRRDKLQECRSGRTLGKIPRTSYDSNCVAQGTTLKTSTLGVWEGLPSVQAALSPSPCHSSNCRRFVLAAEINILPEPDRPRCRAPSGTAGHVEQREQSHSRGGERRDKAGGDLKQNVGVSGEGHKDAGMDTEWTPRDGPSQRPASCWERRGDKSRQSTLQRALGGQIPSRKRRQLWRYTTLNRCFKLETVS